MDDVLLQLLRDFHFISLLYVLGTSTRGMNKINEDFSNDIPLIFVLIPIESSTSNLHFKSLNRANIIY